jgi:hypothetical protein
MPARFYLSSLSRLRSVKFVLLALMAVFVITLATVTARPWRHNNVSAERQERAAVQQEAQSQPEPKNTEHNASQGQAKKRFPIVIIKQEKKPRWEKGLDLTPGVYVLSEVSHLQWECQITVMPPGN